MIDLEKFTKEKIVIVPIVEGWGQINGRKIYKQVEDDWYIVHLGSQVQIERKATLLEKERILRTKKFYRIYILGNEGIPINFNNFSRLGLGESVLVYFLNLQPFEVAKVVRWEDNRYYYYEPDMVFQRSMLSLLKDRFKEEKPINNIKGLTPELTYYWLLLTLQRQSYREFKELERMRLSQEEREKRIKEFQNSFSGRLQHTIESVGGKLLRFVKYRNNWLVTWCVGGQTIKSTIRDNMRIISLGFCASGADPKLTLSAAVLTAKMFQQDSGSVYITRE